MTQSLFERVAPGDRFADYCQWDYQPVAEPQGKFRSCSLLWSFLDLVGWNRTRALCETLREALGPFQTVWGIKQRAGKYALELYFYDYARLDRRVSIARVLAVLSPYLACDLVDVARRPYFMFSLDIDEAVLASGRLQELTLYIGNPGSSVSSGIAYKMSDTGLRRDNLYYFFDRASQLAHIRAKVACSAYLDLGTFRLDALLWPDLMDCGIVVVANKAANDGIYFSRLPVGGFVRFLRKSMFPAPFVRDFETSRGGFDHLLFDVGFDYVVEAGEVKLVKTAIYGLL